MAKNLNKMTPVDELMMRLFHPPRVLVVEEASSPVEVLLHRGYECTVDTARTGEDAVKLLAQCKHDLVLIDLALLNGTSEMVLAAAQRYCPDTPVVVTKLDEKTLETLMKKVGPLTLFTGPLTMDALEHLFRMFRIKARTKEIARYCQQMTTQPVAVTG